MYNQMQRAREVLRKFFDTKIYTFTISSIILLNAISLGLETSVYCRDLKGVWQVLNIVDKVCLGIFTIELALRFFAFGLAFFTDKNQRGWNLFDFIIVVASLCGAGEMSILRSLRIFRVLRLISAFPQMRLITEAMLHTLPSLASVIVLILVFFYMYRRAMCQSFWRGISAVVWQSWGEFLYTISSNDARELERERGTADNVGISLCVDSFYKLYPHRKLCGAKPCHWHNNRGNR